MAPEMAAGYIIGWIPSLSITGLHYWLHKKKIESVNYKQLQKNLSTVNKFWSETQGQLSELGEDSILEDKYQFRKSLLIMGTFFFFMSWVGFFFNLLILFSIHFWAISRKEKKVFESLLCQKDLPQEEVNSILKSL